MDDYKIITKQKGMETTDTPQHPHGGIYNYYQECDALKQAILKQVFE